MSPEQVVQAAKKYNSEGIAYTYNEPSIFMEFAKDCGIEAHKNGIFNIFVSNGYYTKDSIDMAKKFLDCITIDFKGSGEQNFVRQYIGIPSSEPIFQSIKEIENDTNIHLEITDLIVPKVGDNLEAAKKLCRFIYDELGPDIPIHFLRFHPDYKMGADHTPPETLRTAAEIGQEAGLHHVYAGNLPGRVGSYEDTFCPVCGTRLIQRRGYVLQDYQITAQGTCPGCRAKVAGIWTDQPDTIRLGGSGYPRRVR